MLRRNGTANNKSYLLGAMLGSTKSNYACSVPRETKCEHATPLVPLEHSATETIYACLTVLHLIVSQQALNMYVICPLPYISLVAAGKCHHCSSIICCCYNAMLLPLHVAASVCKCAYVCVCYCMQCYC